MTYGKRKILPTPNPNAADGAVVVVSKQTYTGKSGLSHLLQALIHSTDQVTGHKHLKNQCKALKFSILEKNQLMN